MSEEQNTQIKEEITTVDTANATVVAGDKKNKKINKMTLEEIELSLNKTEKNMKGLSSKYARSLLSRKNYILNKSN